MADATRRFICGDHPHTGSEARRNLILAAIELWGVVHNHGPYELVEFLLADSAAESGVPSGDFKEIIRAAESYIAPGGRDGSPRREFSITKVPPSLARFLVDPKASKSRKARKNAELGAFLDAAWEANEA
jgi:hypothetical protein